MLVYVIVNVLFLLSICRITEESVPSYIKQCHEGDPQLIECLKASVVHLTPHLAGGIPEIKLVPVEPFRMEKLSLALTNGPNGYKVALSDIDIFGASNFTVVDLKVPKGEQKFEAEIFIPQLRVKAEYSSSGVLLILPASGKGSFYGTFDAVTAKVRGSCSTRIINKKKYLQVDALDFDIAAKHLDISVKDVYNNNGVLVEAMNLFLNEYGQEVLDLMAPQLRKRLSSEFMGVANHVLSHVPMDIFFVPKKK